MLDFTFGIHEFIHHCINVLTHIDAISLIVFGVATLCGQSINYRSTTTKIGVVIIQCCLVIGLANFFYTNRFLSEEEIANVFNNNPGYVFFVTAFLSIRTNFAVNLRKKAEKVILNLRNIAGKGFPTSIHRN